VLLLSLAPARDENHTNGPEDEVAKHARPEERQALVARQTANSSRKRGRIIADVSQQQKHQQQQLQQPQPVAARLNPYDLRGAPPQSTRTSNADCLAPFLAVPGPKWLPKQQTYTQRALKLPIHA
jgi:hypothetical protein